MINKSKFESKIHQTNIILNHKTITETLLWYIEYTGASVKEIKKLMSQDLKNKIIAENKTLKQKEVSLFRKTWRKQSDPKFLF